MDRNLCEAFRNRSILRKDNTAIQWKNNGAWVKISYTELQDNILALATALRSLYGIKKGDRVAIALGNRPEWPTLFFALSCAGAIPVPINAEGTSNDLNNILADSGCKIVFTDENCPPLRVRSIPIGSDEFRNALTMPPVEEYHAGAVPGDIACIMYTSGTTSHPKGVMLTHGNLLSNMRSLYALGLMQGGDGIVAVLPLHHTYSMAVTTIGPLIYGGRVVYPGSMRSKDVIEAMKESGAALFVGVPIIFEMFHKTVKESLKKMPDYLRFLVEAVANFSYYVRKITGINVARYVFYGIHQSLGKNMRTYMSGGAKLKEEVERDLFKFGFTILNGYGMTEAAPVLTVNPSRNPKIGSVGLPLKDVEIKIKGDGERSFGEILVRGPNVMKGYYKKERLTRRVIEDGWLRTGDVGYMDPEGYLFIRGRADDAITLSSGLSIRPDEVEKIYSAGLPIKEICVFDAPSRNSKSDEVAIWALVVPDMEYFRSNGIADIHSCIKAAFEKVSRTISVPERLMGFSITLDPLPHTQIGKVLRREVKKQFLSGKIKVDQRPEKRQLSEEEKAILQKPEAGKVIDCLRAWTDAKDILPGDSFEFDLGIDMVLRSEVAFDLERILGSRISGDMNDIFTVGELIERAENTRDLRSAKT